MEKISFAVEGKQAAALASIAIALAKFKDCEAYVRKSIEIESSPDVIAALERIVGKSKLLDEEGNKK